MTEPTPYRVATITCNASIGTNVCLPIFFKHVQIGEDAFVWSEYGAQQRGMRPTSTRKRRARKLFDNQVTVVYRLAEGYYPNVKLFTNGSIHMAGIRARGDGELIMTRVADEVRRIHRMCCGNEAHGIVDSVDAVKPGNFCMRMINCSMAFPYGIRRNKLHEVLGRSYGCLSSFQPQTYPGVKVMYYYNSSAAPGSPPGVCGCSSKCLGRGSGSGEGSCKKVTIAVFDSGKALITGGNSFDQVDEAYAYICRVVSENAPQLRKQHVITEEPTH